MQISQPASVSYLTSGPDVFGGVWLSRRSVHAGSSRARTSVIPLHESHQDAPKCKTSSVLVKPHTSGMKESIHLIFALEMPKKGLYLHWSHDRFFLPGEQTADYCPVKKEKCNKVRYEVCVGHQWKNKLNLYSDKWNQSRLCTKY